ncbi:hypothetical protein CHLRE_16g672833v5 [Chlamydomonas reinhardtii]|uniref:Uncharacterized protein n=1 Tax=Chlamydomonas reinhardtii TaxID=3055 RepID=A0A2K3CVQ3_CHLRE|nr:uncharacterized protein CHLRE_16g672833v5 [Chlamydomonas reinhardtii]PNW72367.1 hypothetical protein CHLRE_16g672833v5 [Chlamydomonas reinhardtii]
MELGPRGKTTKQQFATVCSCFGLALTPALINADGGARRYVNTAATLMPVPDLLTAGLGGAALGRDQAHAAAHTARQARSGPRTSSASPPRLTLEHAERLAGPGQCEPRADPVAQLVARLY